MACSLRREGIRSARHGEDELERRFISVHLLHVISLQELEEALRAAETFGGAPSTTERELIGQAHARTRRVDA